LLLSRLPASSAFVEAQLDDPEVAARLVAQPDGPPSRPRVSDWSPDVARLTDIFDRLGELLAAVIATASGGKVKPPPPSPRPSTAVDRLKAQAVKDRHRALVAEVKVAQARYQQRSGAEVPGDT
jgi:hypothetical protein